MHALAQSQSVSLVHNSLLTHLVVALETGIVTTHV